MIHMSYELAPLKIECTQSDITSLYSAPELVRHPVIIKSCSVLSRIMIFEYNLPFYSWF